MGQHPPHLTKQPNWVAFPPETQGLLELVLLHGDLVVHAGGHIVHVVVIVVGVALLLLEQAAHPLCDGSNLFFLPLQHAVLACVQKLEIPKLQLLLPI